MKNKIVYLLLLALFAINMPIDAQRGKGDKPHGKFDVERFKEKRAEYFKREVGLTDEEAKAFLPLTEELLKKKFEANRQIRTEAKDLKQKNNKTDAEYDALLEKILDSKIKEAELEKEYFKKYRKILSAEKLYKYINAERRFMKEVISDYKR